MGIDGHMSYRHSYDRHTKKTHSDAYGVLCDKEQSSFTAFCERMSDMQKGDVSNAKEKGNWSDEE